MDSYRDRHHAGARLAAAIAERALPPPLIVLGIPRGGVIVATEIARALGVSAGVVVARKLGAPGQPELAIGAVAASGAAFIDATLARQVGATEDYIASERRRQADEARRREESFGRSHRTDLRGATVIVVDDGVATGATAIAALRAVRESGAARVVLAVPVAHPYALERLRPEVDELICPLIDPALAAVGQYYADFRQVGDDEVRAALATARGPLRAAARESASIIRGSVTLAATLDLPAGTPPFPAVIFVHGLGSGRDSPRNVVIADALVRAGIAALLFDLSGHGQSSEDPLGAASFPDDVGAAWGWTAAHPALDPGRLAIAGSSLGGVAALQAVARGLATPAAMVLRAPPLERGTIGSLASPTLVVVGQNDPLLPRIRDALPAGSALRLAIIPGAGHLFEEPGALEEAARLTVSWFEDRLAARPEHPR